MSEFFSVGKVSDFVDPSSTLVDVDDEPVVLIHAAGKFYALDDVCTHDGGPLSDGPLNMDGEEPSIVCNRHGAEFALKTGGAVKMPATKSTRSHEVKVEGDEVSVKLID